MKTLQRVMIMLLCVAMLVPMATAFADSSFNLNKDGFNSAYAYTYDYWEDFQYCPAPYDVEQVINYSTLGLDENFKNPESLFVRDLDLYIVDKGNNRIIRATRDAQTGEFTLTAVIKEIKGCDVTTFKDPTDVYVDVNNNIYICDQGNQRIVMVDEGLNFIKEFTKPTNPIYNQENDFKPKRITVDVSGRVYANVQNVNKGLVKFEAEGTFAGFIGANAVTVDMGEYIWKRYIQSSEQRSASENTVPTEYENLYMDNDGFIYVTTITFSEYDLKWDNAKPIRRLNGVGGDILIKNDRYPPIGDLWWIEGASTNDDGKNGPSKFIDITVLSKNDIYIALDKTRGRMFGYDSQGVLLWAFGTQGNINGAFIRPVSLEHMRENDLLVLDQVKNTITVFTTTEYGQLIYDAIDLYANGQADAAVEKWQRIMQMNANYPLAFRQIGRALMRQGNDNHEPEKYKEAMEYFEMAHDRDDYGRAFKLYRKYWVEQNIGWIIAIIVVLLLIPVVSGIIKKMKWEVMVHEHEKVNK